MTAAVDRLERRGLVKRHDDPNDRRARVVHLTKAGRKLIEELFARHRRDMERPVTCLTKAEIASLGAMLRKLGHGAEELLNEERNSI